MTERKARSPYKKYGKTPYRYSDTYRAWLAAVKKHGASSPEARHHAEEHRRKFGGFVSLDLAA